MTPAEYIEWFQDSLREPHRVLLIEIDYAAPDAGVGHGRYDSGSTLNAVTQMQVDTYATSTQAEVTFVQPVLQEGYSWEVWVDGSVATTTQDGDYLFNATSNSTVQVAVASVNGLKYSKPWVAYIQMVPNQQVQGSLGSWADVGEGPGGGGVGTLHLASQPYNDGSQFYHNWLIADNPPVMEDSLEDFAGVGDLDVMNFDEDVDWLYLRWRGYQCRWFYGDTSWPVSEFKQIATFMVSDCRNIGPRAFRFDLMDSGQHLRRQFLDDGVTQTQTFSTKSTIKWILDQLGLPNAAYYNIDQTTRDFRVNAEFSSNDTADRSIQELAASIGAYVRVSQSGQLEVFVPDKTATPAITVTSDDIVRGSIRMIDATPAYRHIKLTMGANGPLYGTTTALTGDLDEVFEYSTLLRLEPDAQVILDELVAFYATTHGIWEMSVTDIAGLIQVGDYIDVEDDELTARGLVQSIRRSPLSPFTLVEIVT